MEYVKVQNPANQLLPHFCFTAIHFRGEFHYVGHVGCQKKLNMKQSELGNP